MRARSGQVRQQSTLASRRCRWPCLSLGLSQHLHHTTLFCYAGLLDWADSFKPPKYLWRTMAALVLGGEVMVRILQGEGCESWQGS